MFECHKSHRWWWETMFDFTKYVEFWHWTWLGLINDHFCGILSIVFTDIDILEAKFDFFSILFSVGWTIPHTSWTQATELIIKTNIRSIRHLLGRCSRSFQVFVSMYMYMRFYSKTELDLISVCWIGLNKITKEALSSCTFIENSSFLLKFFI